LENPVLLLRELQEIELKVGRMKGDQERYPSKIKELDQRLVSEKEAALREKERLETLEKERRWKEGELTEQGERIRKAKGKLFELKTNKEYQAFLHEIEQMENFTGQKEDEILANLEETDQLRESVSKREDALVIVEKETRAEISDIEKKLAQLVEEIATTEKRRKDIIKTMDGGLMKAYEALKVRRGTALAAVKRGACQGCFVNVPPQMFNEVQRNDTLIRCPNCNRFLFWGDD